MALCLALVAAIPSPAAADPAASTTNALCSPFQTAAADALGRARTAAAGNAQRDQVTTPSTLLGIPADQMPKVSADAFRVTIPVYFHVINAGPLPSDGNVPDSQIREQIRVLNRAFAGSFGGARTPFSFQLVSIDRTTNARWFDMALPTSLKSSKPLLEATRALHRGGADALNIYTAVPGQRAKSPTSGIIGFATLPFDPELEKRPELDGVFVDFRTLPGGVKPFDLGHTATHETGHWLGLFHPYDGGCRAPGDHVDDTPPEREPSFGCPEGKDTCPAPGLDPIHNFMDVSDDACYREFTPGQAQRMTEQFVLFRQ